MERFNIFNLIHKGLRASLYQTALELQQTDFTEIQQAELMLDRVREVIMLFEGHASKEDNFVFPAIATYEPAVVTAFQQEHEEDERLGNNLISCISKIESADNFLEKVIAGKELNIAFAAFTAFNLSHMAKEEDTINTILWRYYSDDEIRAINGKIVSGIEPWINDFYSKWMIRGINDHEAFEWFKAVEAMMPEVISQTLLQKAETEWPLERFKKLTGTLNESALVA